MNRFLLFSALTLMSCAPRVQNVAETSDSACQVKVVENGVANVKPDTTVLIQNPGYNACYTQLGFLPAAREYACKNGFKEVALVNIQEPSFWQGPCYQAKAQMYKNEVGLHASPNPVYDLDSISKTGWELGVKLGVGSIVGGMQKNGFVLVNEDGDSANFNSSFMGLRAKFSPIPLVGIIAEMGILGSDAVAPNTKPMPYLDGQVGRLGLELIPYRYRFIQSDLALGLEGGVNYTEVKFEQDFIDFMRTKSTPSTHLTSDKAKGIGYFGGLNVHNTTIKGFVVSGGLRYEFINPKFPYGTTGFDGYSFQGLMSFGYHF